MSNLSCLPPRLAVWLFRLLLHPADANFVLGDLEETYAQLRHRYGARDANR